MYWSPQANWVTFFMIRNRCGMLVYKERGNPDCLSIFNSTSNRRFNTQTSYHLSHSRHVLFFDFPCFDAFAALGAVTSKKA